MEFSGPGVTMSGNKPKGRFDDRIENRVTVSVAVYLARSSDPGASREKTLTENVSPHGARVVSKRRWRSGEEAIIVPRGEFPQIARVVYCAAKAAKTFAWV